MHSIGWMVLAGFVARLLYIVIARSYHFRTSDANFSFGWEIGRVAYSLATGHGYASPFGGDTGPSAWNAPVYPWIVSLAFRLFGSYTHAAAFALLTFNSIFAALTAWPIVRIARRVFNERVAVWSGWLWALLPYIIYWSVRWIWETSLSAFLLTLLLMLTLEMEGDRRLSSWFGYGLLWGIVGADQSLGTVVSALLRRLAGVPASSPPQGMALPAAASAVVFWMTMMPWLVRNYEVFHKPVFVRDNVGVEIRCGNNPIAEGVWVSAYHPSASVVQYEKYKQMGEAAFSAEQMQLAQQWIAEHPRSLCRAYFPAIRLLLERTATPLEVARFGRDQELALPGVVGIRHLGTAAGAEAPGARRVPVCQPDRVLSAGLLCKLSASALPASYRSGAADSRSVLAFRNPPAHQDVESYRRTPGSGHACGNNPRSLRCRSSSPSITSARR